MKTKQNKTTCLSAMSYSKPVTPTQEQPPSLIGPFLSPEVASFWSAPLAGQDFLSLRRILSLFFV